MPYDVVTTAINGLDHPILTAVAVAIDNEWLFTIMLLVLVALEKDWEKRKKTLLALVMVALVGIALKEAFQMVRPCEGLSLKVPCPGGYAFPSTHSAMAFTLAVAFLYRSNYWAYLAFALLVAASRIYLGVHIFQEVAASLVLAALVYSATDRAWRKLHAT